MPKVSKPKEAPGRERFLSLEEKERLLSTCKESPNPYLYPLVSLSLLTAMRFGELVNLKWDDIDFDLQSIILRETKNGDKRVIPLTKAAIAIFKLCPTCNDNPTGNIFRSNRRNNQSGIISVKKSFQNALNIAVLKIFAGTI